MKTSTQIVNICGRETPVRVYTVDAAIIGSGAAGLNCAHTLATLGCRDIAVVTEGLMMGTSRNTGSDKQTYYKLSATAAPDSVPDMAADLAAGGAMHGDLAFIEAALSLRGFYKLVGLGVPFPHNVWGEYTGYKTDHDSRMRATSCGPLTSKYMTEALEKAVLSENIPILDGFRAIEVLADRGRAVGVAALTDDVSLNPYGLALVAAGNVVWATGGPSAIYADTVYPESQTCGLGAPLAAGAEAVNLTESQYGLASTDFRWNLSGSYQQVIPRYISVDADGEEREFLRDYFPDARSLSRAVFLKGYEWPFDPSKIGTRENRGSSAVDLAVFAETQKGRTVYIDYTRNPESINCLSDMDDTARDYLARSRADAPTPAARLRAMNEGAYKLYLDHGIDFEREPLKAAVCAQHCNGGLAGDIWYESTSLPGLFIIGEANGVFGVRRPGGSALNSTQVGSTRAAEKIAARVAEMTDAHYAVILPELSPETQKLLASMSKGGGETGDVLRERSVYARRMSRAGAFMRSPAEVRAALNETRAALAKQYSCADARSLRELSVNRDILLTQAAMLSAIADYIENGGKSRGSFVVTDKTAEELLASDERVEIDTAHSGELQYVSVTPDGGARIRREAARPIPRPEGDWFENVLADYNSKKVFD